MDARPVRVALAGREHRRGVRTYSGLREDFPGQYFGAEANISAVRRNEARIREYITKQRDGDRRLRPVGHGPCVGASFRFRSLFQPL
jgi:hypothetical protein